MWQRCCPLPAEDVIELIARLPIPVVELLRGLTLALLQLQIIRLLPTLQLIRQPVLHLRLLLETQRPLLPIRQPLLQLQLQLLLPLLQLLLPLLQLLHLLVLQLQLPLPPRLLPSLR